MIDKDIEVVWVTAVLVYFSFVYNFAMYRADSGSWQNRSPISMVVESLFWPVVVIAWFVKWLFKPVKP